MLEEGKPNKKLRDSEQDNQASKNNTNKSNFLRANSQKLNLIKSLNNNKKNNKQDTKKRESKSNTQEDTASMICSNKKSQSECTMRTTKESMWK